MHKSYPMYDQSEEPENTSLRLARSGRDGGSSDS